MTGMEDKRDLAQARAEHLPVNRMLRILKQSIPVIPEKTLLGITDLHLPDRWVAVAVSNPDLRDCLHTGKEKALEEQDGFVLAWVSQDLLEDYLKEVEQAFEAGKADRR